MESDTHHSIRWLAFKLHVPVEVLRTLAADAHNHYHPFPRTRNGKTREIDNPDNSLKHVQKSIRRQLLVGMALSDIVHGCVKGRSSLSNASVHVGQRNVASVDIKNFYGSVTNRRIYSVWRHQVGVGPTLAAMLTQLTTRLGHLPHGAPTSDALANLVLVRFDSELECVVRTLVLHNPSRYLDNIDFAGDRTREALPLVIDALRNEGFGVRHKKTYNAGPGHPHVVTGYTVNNPIGPKVGKRGRDKLRAQVRRFIVARQRGERATELALKVRGGFAHMRRTNPGCVRRLQRQIETAGISLTNV